MSRRPTGSCWTCSPLAPPALADVEARAGQVRDLGPVRVIECAESSIATLLVQDRSMRGLCTRLGERHLMLQPAGEQRARAALRKLGYPVGPTTR
jgi:hypothetical protein